MNKPTDKLKWPAIASEDALRQASKETNATVIDGKSEFALGWRMCLDWVQKNYTLTPSPKSIIEINGYWYEYEHKSARHGIDYCLATTDPKQYCNGVYLYSKKDPGSGMEFVITDTNDPTLDLR